jgi:hypothetical protein
MTAQQSASLKKPDFQATILGEFFSEREQFSQDKWAQEAKVTLTEGPFSDRLAEALRKTKKDERSKRKQHKALDEGLHYLYMKGFIEDFRIDESLTIGFDFKIIYKCYDGSFYSVLL